MGTPKKDEIIQKALELWVRDQYRNGCGHLAEITPEYSELLESGYISAAQSELMRNLETKNEEWQNYNEKAVHFQKTLETETKRQNHDKLKPLMDDILAFGDLLIIANKGIGKTNSLMVLAQKFRKLPDTRVIIFEDFPKFCKEFDKMPYFIVHDSDVTETKHTVDLGDFFLRHESDYSVKRGNEIKEALESNKHLIFTMEITDIERSAFFIYSIIEYFFRKAYFRAYKDAQKKEKIIFIIEESQNVFDASVISRKLFNRLRKIFSVARNLDIHFVLASQRLQDLNTKVRGRTRLMFGCVNVDDYELKVRRLLRNSKYKTKILNFERGKFLYTANDSVIQFPKFKAKGKPYPLKPKSKPKTDTQKPSEPYILYMKPRAKRSSFRAWLKVLRFLFWVDKGDLEKPIHRSKLKTEPEQEEDLEDGDALTASNNNELDESLLWT